MLVAVVDVPHEASHPRRCAAGNVTAGNVRQSFGGHRSRRLVRRLPGREKLSGDRDRDLRRQLGADAGQTDRAMKAIHRRFRKAGPPQAAREPRPFRVGADRADEGQVAAAQRRLAEGEVGAVVMRHDEHHGAGRQRRDVAGLGRASPPGVGGDRFGKDVRPGVEPKQPAGQVPQQLGNRPPDMAGAEQRHGPTRRPDRLEQNRGRAAAALAERGTERKVPLRRRQAVAPQDRAGIQDALVFQIAAADRIPAPARRDDHLDAGLAWGRTPCGDHAHQNAGLATLVECRQRVEPDGHQSAASVAARRRGAPGCGASAPLSDG